MLKFIFHKKLQVEVFFLCVEYNLSSKIVTLWLIHVTIPYGSIRISQVVMDNLESDNALWSDLHNINILLSNENIQF